VVNFQCDDVDLIGKFAQVRIGQAFPHSLSGELVTSELHGVAPFDKVMLQ
jgi:tRNA-2-methylthio-N6-dimethylallyladenosine synthase